MPKKGYKSITVPDKLHETLKKNADEHKVTIPKEIENLTKTPKEP